MTAETVRISTAKLDSVLWQAEEMLVAKLAIHQRVAEMRGIETELERWQKEWAKIEPMIQAEKDQQKVLEDFFWALLNTDEFLFNH